MAKATKARKVPTTGSERWQHLQEQMEFLRRSCAAFDEGFLAEAKRMSADVTKLVLHERHFKSVLSQVGLMPHMGFISTTDVDAIGHGPRLLLKRVSDIGISYAAPAGKIPIHHRKPRVMTFPEWWNEAVITLPNASNLTRERIVRWLRDQYGGGHVDPEIDADMAELRRDNPVGTTWSQGGLAAQKLPDVELHTMRQIAHEVLISIERKLAKG